MKRIGMLMAILALAATVAHAAAAPLFYEIDYHFATTLEGFRAGAVDMNLLTKTTLRHAVEPAPTQQSGLPGGNGYALLTNDSGAEAIYMWTVAQGTGQQVRLNFQAKDIQGCGRYAVIAYVGASKLDPHSIAGFQKVGLLKTGWASYSVQFPVNTESVVVALGIMNLDPNGLNVNGESGLLAAQAGIDEVQIQFLDD